MIVPFPLVFVRHGETDWNVDGRLQGLTDTRLNPRGRDQASAVGRTLLHAFPDIGARPFFASPLGRTVETTRLMRAAIGVEPDGFVRDERLRELSFGRWEGSTFREIRTREPAAMKVRDAERWTHRPPGGESYSDLVDRLAGFFGSLIAPAVVVAHGGVARAALSLLTDAATDALPDLYIRQSRAIVFDAASWRWV